MSEDHTERLDRVKLNNERLERITALNDDLWTVDERLEAAWATLEPLMDYYQEHWQEDLAALDGTPDGECGLFSEDGVWNEMGRFYSATKYIAQVAARLVEAYEAPVTED